MKKVLLTLFFLIVTLFAPTQAFAIGSFDASNITVTSSLVQFNFDNLDRTNDGEFGGYGGQVIASHIYCFDTESVVAITEGNGFWNTGNLVSYLNTNYDGSPHTTNCAIRINTNSIEVPTSASNDYQSNQRFDIPTNSLPSPTPTPTVPLSPTNKDQCEKDGWKVFTNPSFKNQGDCVSFVASHR